MKERIGFIGLGAMGLPMAKNILKKGYQVTAYDIVPQRVEELIPSGAIGAASSKEVAEQSDVIITMVPSSSHSWEAILGSGGVIEGVKKGAVVIDMSTIDPVTTRAIAARGLRFSSTHCIPSAGDRKELRAIVVH